MIKFLVGGIIILILALVGGAVEFKSTDTDYSLVMNKEAAKVSVYNGVVKTYGFVKELIDDNINASTTSEANNQVEKANQVEKVK